MTDEELGRALSKVFCNTYTFTSLGTAARTILAAERPEVTREAVDKFLADVSGIPSVFRLLVNRDAVIDFLKIAISHFAPPREARPNDGMSVEMLANQFRHEWFAGLCGRGSGAGDDQFMHCARVAHRLAQPVPVVDPDAEAKRLAWRYYQNQTHGQHAEGDNREKLWIRISPNDKCGWRAVAAAKGDVA